jgi:Domain of unknown function (DUF5671)
MAALGIIRILLIVIVLLAFPAAIVGGVVFLVRRVKGAQRTIDEQAQGGVATAARASEVPAEWERFIVYALSFAGLITILFALSRLLSLGAELLVQHVTSIGTLIASGDAKSTAANSLAALIVGTPLWLGFWRAAQRRVARTPAEREALERRLFLGAIFAVTAIAALFALRSLLHVLLALPGSVDHTSAVKDGISAGVQLLAFGAAWLVYARLGWRERGPRAADVAHDLAVYTLAGFALIFLSIGVGDAVHHLVLALQGTSENVSPADTSNATWSTWGEVASWILAGGLVWVAIRRYDTLRAGARMLRVVYLYLVLAVAAPTALITGGNLLYELLRRGFGNTGSWSFLTDSLPPLLVGCAVWAYHWIVVRRQASLVGTLAPGNRAILWPRRLAIATLALGGLIAAVYGLVGLLSVGIDLSLTTHAAAHGGEWWRDPFSAALAAAVLGITIWVPAWYLLQRAAEASPEVERRAWERRWLLGAIVMGGALLAIGFISATLYQVFRGILQTTDANTLSDGLRYGAATAVTTAIVAYYFSIFRRERRPRAAASASLRVAALVAPGEEEHLVALNRATGLQIETLGYLGHEVPPSLVDPALVQEQLNALGNHGDTDRALLILHANGAVLYPYNTRIPAALSEAVVEHKQTSASLPV